MSYIVAVREPDDPVEVIYNSPADFGPQQLHDWMRGKEFRASSPTDAETTVLLIALPESLRAPPKAEGTGPGSPAGTERDGTVCPGLSERVLA